MPRRASVGGGVLAGATVVLARPAEGVSRCPAAPAPEGRASGLRQEGASGFSGGERLTPSCHTCAYREGGTLAATLQ